MNLPRWLTLGLIPLAIYGALGLPFALNWSELPNPMASHWGLNGAADGAMPPAVLLALLVGIMAAVHISVVRVVNRIPDEAASFIAGLCAIGALLAGVGWLSVLANRGQTDWHAAGGLSVVGILLLLAVAGGAGMAGWWLAGGRPTSRPNADRPVLDVANPTHAVWSSHGTGKLPYVLGAVSLIIGLATWGLSTVVFILIGLVLVTFADVRTTVSQRGVVVSMGWLGFPSWIVPLSEIANAEVETVSPMAYGGWGYRVRPDVRAVVARGGDGLRLVRTGKPDLVVTVDDSATGAGLINSMLGASRS
ncbi:MAG: DUF1648 domain-containing protein [bacterium]|nr:DUF1648 domain-containing protein [bacterium]MCP4965443.1 DUF1648 domain-containing protein [bacterium]